MERLEDRVALVTGGASGIGKATARRIASEGAAVAISDIQTEAGEALAEELRAAGHRAIFIQHDVTSESGWADAIERVTAEFGGLHVLGIH